MSYCCATIMKGLPEGVHLTGRVRKDSSLYGLPEEQKPGTRGRPRKKGRRLPTPQEMFEDAQTPWKRIEVRTYGKTKIIDPRTGELIKDPVSATVIADKAIDADTLSTLSIISPEIGLRIVKRLGFEALIIYQSGKILKTSGFKGYEV